MNSKSSWIMLGFILLVGLLVMENITVFASDNSTNITNTTIINTTLEVWSSVYYVNETATIYANYSDENMTIVGIDICKLDSSYYDFNMTLELYTHKVIYSQPGNYTLTTFCEKQGYENQTLDITLEILGIEENITIIDSDNDTYSEDVDCDDNNPDINPGQTEILYNNIDDDCNIYTLDYLIFEITSDKEVYNPQETVSILINAKNGSDTYITINTPTNVSYVYIFTDGSYPVTQEFSLTSLSGLYSVDAVNYYENYTNVDVLDFLVDTNLNVDISVNKDEAFTDESISFEAIITGGIGDTNMIWNMDDGYEKYDTNFDYSYSSSRTYNVVLLVTDSAGNQAISTKQIRINPKYTLTVEVRDDDTDELLTNALVELDGEDKTVDSNARAEFEVTNSTYDLEVHVDNYQSYDEDIKINNSLVFTVRLNKEDEEIIPTITLLSPENNTDSDKSFKFKFDDNQNAECTLYLSGGDGWWYDSVVQGNLAPNTDHIFTANTEDGEYRWKIHCRDEDDNLGVSRERLVRIGQPDIIVYEDSPTTYNVVQDVYDIIPDFDTYSPDDKKIAEYLKLDVLIKDAKRKLDKANSDLFDLRFKPDTTSVIETRDEIYAEIDVIKDITPLSVTSEKKVEFVKYLSDEDLSEVLSEYITLKKLDLSKRETKALLAQITALQKEATIQTTAYNVLIQYISGRTEDITLVARTIDLAVPSKNYKYVEFIPKELVESTDEIVFVTENVQIVQKDPVFEVDLNGITEMIYYVNKDLLLDDIPKIRPVIITTVIDESMSGITGLAIFDNLGFSESNRKVFVIQLLIVFVLFGVYLFFYFRSGATFALPKLPNIQLPNPKPKQEKIREIEQKPISDIQKMDYINSVIRKAETTNLGDAALKYHEAKFLYESLEQHEKNMLYPKLLTLANNITLKHVKEMLDQALIALAHNNYSYANSLYEDVQEEFEKLSEEDKSKVYNQCCELALYLKNEA